MDLRDLGDFEAKSRTKKGKEMLDISKQIILEAYDRTIDGLKQE